MPEPQGQGKRFFRQIAARLLCPGLFSSFTGMPVDSERMRVAPKRMQLDHERMRVAPKRMQLDRERMRVASKRMHLDSELMLAKSILTLRNLQTTLQDAPKKLPL